MDDLDMKVMTEKHEAQERRLAHEFKLAMPRSMEKKRGRLIVFDGIDGSGKGSLIDLLEKRLLLHGRKVTRSKQPGGSKFGDDVRKLLFDGGGTKDIDPDALTLVLDANEIHNVNTVMRPALERGEIVLADRFYPSAHAYRCARSMGKKPDSRMIDFREAIDSQLSWDLFFLLVGDPYALLKRARARADGAQQTKKWNDPEVMAAVQDEFLRSYSLDPKTRVVDTTWADAEWTLDKMVWPVVRRELGI